LPDLYTTDENYTGKITITNASGACDYFTAKVDRTPDPGSGFSLADRSNIHIGPGGTVDCKYTINPSVIAEGTYEFSLNLTSRRHPEIFQRKTVRYKVVTGTSALHEQKAEAGGIIVFPVPAQDHICFSLPDQKTGFGYIRIFSADGRILISREFHCQSGLLTLDTEELSPYKGQTFIYNIIMGSDSHSGTFVKD